MKWRRRRPEDAAARADHPRFFCLDCDADTYVNQQYYMLKDELWKKINPSIDGMLCLPCVEKRLRRSLTRKDFKRGAINTGQARVCPELAKRLRRAP
jgi:hypothetical protein